MGLGKHRLVSGKAGHLGRGTLFRPLGGTDKPGRASCSYLTLGRWTSSSPPTPFFIVIDLLFIALLQV